MSETTNPTSSAEATPVDDLATILGTVADLVASVGTDQWHSPTPCTDWDVRDLVTHMVLGHRLFAGVLRGTAESTPDALEPANRDALGNDPATAYRTAAEDLLDAIRQPGVLEGVFVVPAGRVPGPVAVHLRAVEELVHGWDVARATGQPIRFADDLVEREEAFTRAALEEMPQERSTFASPQPVSAGAPPLDRLVALLGRQPE